MLYAVIFWACLCPVFLLKDVYANDGGNEQYLVDILKEAYENNPTLRAARAELEAVEEDMVQANAGWKPYVDAQGNVSNVEIDGSNFGGEGTTSKEMEVVFNQPLYRGGRTVAAIDAAEEKILAQKAILESVEQAILRDVATAYMDVLRDSALLDLSINNENVLKKDLEATQDRFTVGELTLTDVAQAEARLARAQAERIKSAGNFQTSCAFYEKITGKKPGALFQPILNFPIPDTLEEATVYAEDHNPSVKAARYFHRFSEGHIREIFGELLPELSFFGSWNRQLDPQPGLIKESTTQTVGISATIPLYQGGAVRSRIRQAKHIANQRYLETLETDFDIRERVVTNWQTLETAKAEISFRESQVKAAQLAQEGVREENILGARTVLDTLDADQELLDAQVTLISAQRNKIVAEFSLAETLGMLVPEMIDPLYISHQIKKKQITAEKILGIDADIDAFSLNPSLTK